MKLLLLFTSYRQLEEFDYQAIFLKKCTLLKNSDVLLHCNNPDISREILEKKLNKLPVPSTKITYGNNVGGYLRGQFQAITEVFDMEILQDYDFVIHLHPDIFITDERPIINLLSSDNEQSVLFVSRIFGNAHPSFATDFFIFRPLNYLREIFSDWSLFEQKFELPLECIFFESIKKHGVDYLEVERFKTGRYFRDIDQLGLWHEHRLEKIESYMRNKLFRYRYLLSDAIEHPRLSLGVTRDYFLRLIRREKTDGLLQLLSR